MKLLVVASGPYLDVEGVNRCNVPKLTINSSIFEVTGSDYFYFDAPWGYRFSAILGGLSIPRWTHGWLDGTLDEEKVRADLNSMTVRMNDVHNHRFLHDPNEVACGRQSAVPAVNLAYHLGYREVYLAGVDCCAGPDGKPHFFGSHPEELNNAPACLYPMWIEAWQEFASSVPRDLKIYNCDPESAVECFEKVGLPYD